MIEGNTLENSNCNGAIEKIADWIVNALGGDKTQLVKKTESFEAREIAADNLIGQYYDVLPEFTSLCDAVADGTNVRKSAVRGDALRCINERLTSAQQSPMKSSSLRDLAAGVAA